MYVYIYIYSYVCFMFSTITCDRMVPADQRQGHAIHRCCMSLYGEANRHLLCMGHFTPRVAPKRANRKFRISIAKPTKNITH